MTKTVTITLLTSLLICCTFSAAYCDVDFLGLGKKLFNDEKYEQAAETYEKACYYGSSKGCFDLAEMLDTGNYIAKDSLKALTYYQKACELGFRNDNESCTIAGLKFTLMGLSFETGTGYEQNFEKAMAAYKMACGYENGQGCTNLGRFYEEGKFIRSSMTIAVDYYYKGCVAGDGQGCYHVGKLFELGKGVVKDIPKAKRFYKRACDKGYKTACLDAKAAH